VRSISHSFADEVFAILVVSMGDEWFREFIHAQNLTGALRLSVLSAIERRLELIENEIVKPL